MLFRLYITNEPAFNDHVLEKVIETQKLKGELIYLTNTRPDISYTLYCLSQFMHSPSKSHLKIALKVLRHLKTSPGKDIHILRTPNYSLEAYVDADWAKCVATRRSLTWYNFFSKSSTKAEYRVMASIAS